jgi:TRAP transporter TAXI family solute receptor
MEAKLMVSSKYASRIRPAIRILVVMMLAATLVASHARAAEPLNVFRIATASKKGTFYPIGSLIAKGLSGAKTETECRDPNRCGVPGLIAVAQVSNGSVANVETVSAGKVEAGLAQADVVYWAYTGTGRFANSGPLTGFRVVANLYPGSLHIVTSATTGIAEVADLAGKRVALDEPGSGTLATAELILASLKIRKSDLHPLYTKHNYAGPMLAKGQLDAFFFVAGYPTRSVIDVAKTTDIRLVPLSDRTVMTLVTERPYFAPGIIPAGTYGGINDDISTVDIGTQLIVRADLDEELVYALTAALWNERTRNLLDEGHPKGAQVKLDTALRGIGAPLHSGAERFYRELNLIKK